MNNQFNHFEVKLLLMRIPYWLLFCSQSRRYVGKTQIKKKAYWNLMKIAMLTFHIALETQVVRACAASTLKNDKLKLVFSYQT